MATLANVIARGTDAAKPAAGEPGRIYFASDTKKTYRDNGSTWDDVSDAGAVTSVAGRTGVVVLSSSDVSGLATSATTDTTNASNITSGTLDAARLPKATATSLGGVEVDGTSITIDANGKISAASQTGAVTSVAGRTGAVVLSESDISGLTTDLAAKAPLASPALTGTPTAPTAATSDNSTTIATTAFVKAQGGGAVPTGAGVIYNGTSDPGSGNLPTVIQSRAASGANSLAFSSNVASGNLLVVVASDFSANMSTATLSDTLGTSYSAIAVPTANSLAMRIFYGIAPSSGANSVTVSGYTAGGWQNVQILEVAHVQAVLDGTLVSAGGASPGSLTTSHANSLVVVGLAGLHNATTWTPPSGWTITQANGTDAGGVAYETLSGTATVSPTFTGTSVADGLAAMIAFQATTVASVGNNNDYFVNTSTNKLFGPKASGAWPSTALPLLAYVTAPATHSSTGTTGQVAYDSSGNFYWCYAANTWARMGPGGYSNAF